MRLHFNKNKNYTMDVHTADRTLQNVFLACHKESNRIPYEKLLPEPAPRTGVYTAGKWIALIMLILTFFSPLVFPHSPLTPGPEGTQENSFTLDHHYVLDGQLYLRFFGESVNPESCYMLTDSGLHYTSIYFDESKNTIAFPFCEENANIYIESQDGSVMHLLVSTSNQ